MSSEQNISLNRRRLNETWNDADYSMAAEILAESLLDQHPSHE